MLGDLNSSFQYLVVRGSGEEAPGGRSSRHQSEEETEGPETAPWLPQPGRGPGLPAPVRGPVRHQPLLGAPTSRHDQRISSLFVRSHMRRSVLLQLIEVFLNLLFTFCLNRFGWNSRRTEETLQPVMKQLGAQQVEDDSFLG